MAKTIIYIHGKGGNAEEAIISRFLATVMSLVLIMNRRHHGRPGKNFRNSLTRSAGMLSLWKSLPTA